MPDAWEARHRLDPGAASDATQDGDGDGYTAIEEYLNGTDPTAFVDYTNRRTTGTASTSRRSRRDPNDEASPRRDGAAGPGRGRPPGRARAGAGAGGTPPRYVATDAAGRLVYEADGRGDRIPDFSHCGYRGGGVAIPDAPVRVVVAPAEGDDGPAIQAAIDHVAGLPADEGGLRGAVLLEAGRYEVAGSLRIAAGGVVLRGPGGWADGTVLVAGGPIGAP
jgi:hypothetical protein